MYNRYIPQPDGSFRRRAMEDRSPPPPPPRSEPIPCHQEEVKPPPSNCRPHRNSQPHKRIPPSKQENGSVTGFLKRLLPKNFDTGDLFVVLLLLLMAGDCAEDQNTAMLTLALYFFM